MMVDGTLTAAGVSKFYRTAKPEKAAGPINGLRAFDAKISSREIVGVVGSSGSGKSTLARLLTGGIQPDEGMIEINGTPITSLSPRSRATYVQHVQQDPTTALNPARQVWKSVALPLIAAGAAKKVAHREALEMLLQVGLTSDQGAMYPGQLSIGQRQRVSIARALIGEPMFVVCDEPTSALDLSVQAQIINLLLDLKQARKFGLVFISHDVILVRQISDRILVLDGGSLVDDFASSEELENLSHAGRALFSAALFEEKQP